jgi:hypothetical protein
MICRARLCCFNAVPGFDLCAPHLEEEEDGRKVPRKPGPAPKALDHARGIVHRTLRARCTGHGKDGTLCHLFALPGTDRCKRHPKEAAHA